mgnify:CR=1 FL=1
MKPSEAAFYFLLAGRFSDLWKYLMKRVISVEATNGLLAVAVEMKILAHLVATLDFPEGLQLSLVP